MDWKTGYHEVAAGSELDFPVPLSAQYPLF